MLIIMTHGLLKHKYALYVCPPPSVKVYNITYM